MKKYRIYYSLIYRLEYLRNLSEEYSKTSSYTIDARSKEGAVQKLKNWLEKKHMIVESWNYIEVEEVVNYESDS